MEFKDQLKKLRTKKNVTQEALGNAIHVSRSAVAKWETGLGLPNEDSVLALCEYFSVARSELFPDAETQEIMVAKNRKIRKHGRVIAILSALLSVVLFLVCVFQGVRLYDKKQETETLKTLFPTVTELYLEPKTEIITNNLTFKTESPPFRNEAYELPYDEWTEIYFEVIGDQRLFKKAYSLTPEFDGFEAFHLHHIKTFYHVDGDNGQQRMIYSIFIRAKNENVSEVSLTDIVFIYFPNGVLTEKSCVNQAVSLPVRIV